MSDLLNQIRNAQVRAAEDLVIASLRDKGLLTEEPLSKRPVGTETRVVSFWKDNTIKVWCARDAEYASSDPGFLINVPLASILAAAEAA